MLTETMLSLWSSKCLFSHLLEINGNSGNVFLPSALGRDSIKLGGLLQQLELNWAFF